MGVVVGRDERASERARDEGVPQRDSTGPSSQPGRVDDCDRMTQRRSVL